MKITITDIIIIIACIFIGYGIHSFVNYKPNNNITVTEIKLEGKTSYSLGDIADYSATIDNSKIELISDWKVIRNNQDISYRSLGNNTIIFPVGIEKSNIQLIFHGSYIDPSTKKIKSSGIIVKDISVGGSVPTPPNPPPTPEPDTPTIPEGRFQISNKAYTTAVALVHSSNIGRSANALSKTYSKVSDNILQNKYIVLKDVYEDLSLENNKALTEVGEDKQNWQAWDNVMKSEISSLHKNGKLPKMGDHADLLKEISIGLSYVK